MELKLIAFDGDKEIVVEVIQAKHLLEALAKLHVKLNEVGMPRKYWNEEERITADKLFCTQTDSDNEPVVSC